MPYLMFFVGYLLVLLVDRVIVKMCGADAMHDAAHGHGGHGDSEHAHEKEHEHEHVKVEGG